MVGIDASRLSSSSFRDPAGYVFLDDGVYRRVVTDVGAADYENFVSQGLLERLSKGGLLVAHAEEPGPSGNPRIHKVLVPEQIKHISNPYEWSFGELRDAALLTLDIERTALAHGMSLKDASAFNIQFRGPYPVFIDTLSFEKSCCRPLRIGTSAC